MNDAINEFLLNQSSLLVKSRKRSKSFGNYLKSFLAHKSSVSLRNMPQLCVFDDACEGNTRLPAVVLHRSWLLCRLQGIERLKGETGKWGKMPCWESMQVAFGGPLSLAWCSPFTGLTCKRTPAEQVRVPLGEIIEEDVIEIPME